MVSEPLLVLFSTAFTPTTPQSVSAVLPLLFLHWSDPQCLLPMAKSSDLGADW